MNPEETASLVNAGEKMPNLKGISGLLASQFVKTVVLVVQICRLLCLEESQSRNLGSHNGVSIVPFSFLHSDFQHVVGRSTNSKYHDAPKT